MRSPQQKRANGLLRSRNGFLKSFLALLSAETVLLAIGRQSAKSGPSAEDRVILGVSGATSCSIFFERFFDAQESGGRVSLVFFLLRPIERGYFCSSRASLIFPD